MLVWVKLESAITAVYKIVCGINQPVSTAKSPKISPPIIDKEVPKALGVLSEARLSPSSAISNMTN